MKYHFGGMVLLSILLAGCGSSSSSSDIPQPKAQVEGESDTDVVDSVSSMSKGDLYYVSFNDAGSAAINFSGSSSDAKYTLIIQSSLQSSSSVTVTPASVSVNIADEFDEKLREQEYEFSISNIKPVSSPQTLLSKSLDKAVVGDSSTFRVLSSISSRTSYIEVTATAKCVEDHIIVYIDNRVSSDILENSDIETLCTQFEHAASTEEAILGIPSDVNGDGHVTILITPAVNSLGASGGGIITGYFYSNDLYARSSSNPTSNGMEIIYILSPDPDGTYGTEITKAFALSNLMPAVVPHELQHAISFNQHSLVNNGSSEENWLNEALSHFAEDLVGFGQENPSRIEGFLNSPETTVLAPTSSPDIDERGAEYTFIRFLYERAANPNEFLSALENTTNIGTENVVSAFAGTDSNFDEWSELMRRWAIAIAITNTGISSTAQYQFNDRTLNATTSEWQGVCLICTAEDGRDTVLTGPYMTTLADSAVNLSLSETATAFYTISSPPSSITISGNSSAGLQGVLIRTE